jgi:hypothetical protein
MQLTFDLIILVLGIGNASQVSDGAAAVLLARRSVAKKLNLPILGKFVAAVAVGVPPRIMGVGPAYAIPKLLNKLDITKDDVDFYEINEAFASQAYWCVNKIGIPFEKVNLHGGAIAFGHPLGCSEYSFFFPSLAYHAPFFLMLIAHGFLLLSAPCSWRPTSRYWPEHLETDRRKIICH